MVVDFHKLFKKRNRGEMQNEGNTSKAHIKMKRRIPETENKFELHISCLTSRCFRLVFQVEEVSNERSKLSELRGKGILRIPILGNRNLIRVVLGAKEDSKNGITTLQGGQTPIMACGDILKI